MNRQQHLCIVNHAMLRLASGQPLAFVQDEGHAVSALLHQELPLELNTQLGVWARKHGGGVTFDSSTGFALPNGAKRSPDASWLPEERWDGLTPEGFAPLCPYFVV